MFVVSRLVHGLDLRRLLTLGVGFVLLSWPVIWVPVVLEVLAHRQVPRFLTSAAPDGTAAFATAAVASDSPQLAIAPATLQN
jgi:hypothetical protein